MAPAPAVSPMLLCVASASAGDRVSTQRKLVVVVIFETKVSGGRDTAKISFVYHSTVGYWRTEDTFIKTKRKKVPGKLPAVHFGPIFPPFSLFLWRAKHVKCNSRGFL